MGHPCPGGFRKDRNLYAVMKYKNTRTGNVFYTKSPVRGEDIVALDDDTPVVEEEPKKETKKNVSRKKPVRNRK